jgi:hypothetical protein
MRSLSGTNYTKKCEPLKPTKNRYFTQNSSTCDSMRSLSGTNHTKKSTPLKPPKNRYFTTGFKYVRQAAKPFTHAQH